MKNALLDKGIILPSGEISKDKINLVTGAITQLIAEMAWVTTGEDMETVNRLTDVLVTMNTPADRGKLFKIIKMLYGLMGLPFSKEVEPKEDVPLYMVKHQVRPGITGWAQVNGLRGDTSIKARVEHDVYYIEHWSLLFDIEILLTTVFRGKFVNSEALN